MSVFPTEVTPHAQEASPSVPGTCSSVVTVSIFQEGTKLHTLGARAPA